MNKDELKKIFLENLKPLLMDKEAQNDYEIIDFYMDVCVEIAEDYRNEKKNKKMNKKIYDLFKHSINDFESEISNEFGSNVAIFEIFNNFFNILKNNKKLEKHSGVEITSILVDNILSDQFSISEDSWNNGGITFVIKFDKNLYSINFKRFRDGSEMIYSIYIKNVTDVNYSGEFIFKYFLGCALEVSKLKGSYFSMPRNRFYWDIKTPEKRTFNDIYLPNSTMNNLKLYTNIFKENERVLRYLMVGNPGTCKTESTLVLANELNNMGVTIIKTPICEKLHEKVELANVLAPSLLIFDDIDLSLGDRNSGAYSTLLGDFLDVLDGTDKLSNSVGVIATTNAAHLLDLAAQRPGRFDKTLLFNDITKDNIKSIILKSLNIELNIKKGDETAKICTDNKVINKLYDAGVSGSHIYNTIKMLNLKYSVNKNGVISVKNIISDIESDLKVIEEIRKTSFLKEKYDRKSGTDIGFNRGLLIDKDELMEEDLEWVRESEKNKDYQ